MGELPIIFYDHFDIFFRKVLSMIQKVITRRDLKEHLLRSIQDDLVFWLNRTPDERIAAVEYLRRQRHGNTARLQRSARVVQLS